MFGSKAMAFIPKEKRKKFDAKSKEYLFIGYCETQKGYRLMDAETNQVIVCRDVEVIEHGNNCASNANNKAFEFIADIFENNNSTNGVQHDLNSVASNMSGVRHGQKNVASTLSENNVNGVQHGQNNVASGDGVQHGQNNVAEESSSRRDGGDEDFSLAGSDESVYDDADDSTFIDSRISSSDDSDVQIIRRSERGTKQPSFFGDRVAHLAANSGKFLNAATDNEPLTVSEALGGLEKLQWTAAMDEEYRSLIDNGTWQLEYLPDGHKAINCKWVFKRKTDASGNLTRYKARLVAKGYNQREGIDYVHTFSPVVRYSSIRLLMAMTVKFSWQIEQMDVVTAFLHGDVQEAIYMQQPEAYDDGSGRVCRLKKALYGLKQASRQWNLKLNDVLKRAGYKRCKTDSCVYVQHNENSTVAVAVYVDDLLIFFNNETLKDQLKSTLKEHFCMKDLGAAKSILGIRIDYDFEKGVLSLDQQKYTESILRKFRMLDCDPVRLPSDPNQKLTALISPTTEEEAESG